MAGKSKSQTTKAGKSASPRRGLLSEEDRSLWQRVVDSLEMRRAKNDRGRTKHSVAPMSSTDELYGSLQPQKSNKSKTTRAASHTNAKTTAPSPQLNGAELQDDLGLWDNFKSTLDHQKPKKNTAIQPKRSPPNAAPAYTRPSAPAQPTPIQQDKLARAQHNTLQHHPLEDRIAKKLAKKKILVDARIDLHGMTQDQAHRALEVFLINAQKNALSIVLVITGKGSQGQGILRHVVPQWLHSDPFSQMTNGFRHASAHHGGTGALYVRVRKLRNSR